MGYIVVLILVFLLSACAPAPTGAPATPGVFSVPTGTATATALPGASSTPALDLTATQDWVQFQVTLDALKTRVVTAKGPTPTPTLTLFPLPTEIPRPTKQVLMEYDLYPGLGGENLVDFVMGDPIPELVLYSDGQLILQKKKLLEKNLSVVEICSLLKKIEDLGYYQLIYDKGLDLLHNPLYNFPSGMDPGGNDGPNYHILVNGPNPKDVWVNYLYYDRGYAVPPVKKLIQFLSNYQPPGMQEYQPDRLLLLILPGREDWVKNQSPAQWPDANIHLSDYADDWKGMYLTGDIVPKIYAIFKSPYVDRVLVDQGQEFTVSSRPLLPHESRGPFGGNPESTKTAQYPLPFQCAK